MHREMRNVYKILSGGQYGIKMDFRKTGFGDIDWIQLAQDRTRSKFL
jgi:hypothetical protein